MKTPQKAGLTKYIHHAQRFGTESVMETAADQGLGFDQLVELQKEIDKIEKANAPRIQRKRGPRISAEIRVRRLLGLPDEEEGGEK